MGIECIAYTRTVCEMPKPIYAELAKCITEYLYIGCFINTSLFLFRSALLLHRLQANLDLFFLYFSFIMDALYSIHSHNIRSHTACDGRILTD